MLSSSKIGEKAALILNDAGYITWTVSEMAKWINAACRELVLLKPTALVATVAVLLLAGTRQSLIGASFVNPVDGSAAVLTPLQLLEVVRNMGSDGTQAGSAVVGVERKVLDVMLPGWHQVAAGSEIRNFMFDPKDPKTFYNYPQATASPAMYAEVVVSRAPINTLSDAAVALGNNDIDADLDDVFESALVDNVLSRAFAKDSNNQAYLARSQGHYNAFANAIGVKLQNETRQKPQRQFDPTQGGQ